MQNSMAMLTFSFFDGKYSFWANLIQKIKIVNLRSNSVLKLIQICRIEWLYFCYRPEITLRANLVQHLENVSLKLTFGTSSTSNMHNSIVLFTSQKFDTNFNW